VDLLRVNVQDPTAQNVLQQLNFRFTPTFVLLDGDGREVWRAIGSIDAETARAEVRQLEQGR